MARSRIAYLKGKKRRKRRKKKIPENKAPKLETLGREKLTWRVYNINR